jgi:DNA-directed RNA polymerase specialized sigma24 family protein
VIPWVHQLLIDWAVWVRQQDHSSGGYGKLVIAKVVEGKGEILPSARFVPSKDIGEIDQHMLGVERLISHLSKSNRKLVKVVYLTSGSMEEKAKYLRIDRRTLYGRLHRIHSLFTTDTLSGKL